MTVEQMREFAVLAEERNYLVAADKLYETQATLSRHIMAMEEELGFLLFNRSTKKIELTPEGNRFLIYARNAVKIQDAYKAAIENIREVQDGVLRVGYSPLVSFYRVTDQLTQFMVKNPDLDIKFSEAKSEELTTAVREGTLDVAFLMENPFEKPTKIDFIRFSTDILVAILPKGHPLENRKSLDLSELKDDLFAFAPLDSEPALVELEACRRCGFEPTVNRSGLVGHTLYDWVASTGNVALDWKEPALHHRANDISLVDVEPPLYSNAILIYKRKNLSSGAKKLIKYFEKHSTALDFDNL